MSKTIIHLKAKNGESGLLQPIVSIKSIETDPLDSPENDVAYCPDCEEEYTLPEDTETCPICGSASITFVF